MSNRIFRIDSKLSSGSNGSIGPTGPIGPIGVCGSIGPTGPTGSIGPQNLNNEIIKSIDNLEQTILIEIKKNKCKCERKCSCTLI